MKQLPKVSRRSFLATVAGATGGVVFAGTAQGETMQGCTDSDPSPPRGDPGGRGRNCTSRPQTGCSDSDSGPNGDPGGGGRNCRPQGPVTGCSDRDPSDPSSRGRNCGGGGGGDGQPTGRRERTYEVCWVDHPSRSNEECNIQTYSEWATTFSDGRIEYDTAESQRRRAEMEARGYTARWHRMIVNEW